MSLVFSTTADLPQGFETVTINAVAYKVDAVSMPSFENRKIERPDENGDRADFELRDGAEHIEGSITIQRALTTTVLPPNGTSFTYDFDRSGTASTLVVNGTTVQRDKDAHDVFEVPVVLVTYQA